MMTVEIGAEGDIYLRNFGYINMAAQRKLWSSCVAVAGTGGVGGELAVLLAKVGVGHLRVADPDVFDNSNRNRQTGASRRTIGAQKAEVLTEMVGDINGDIEVECFVDGVTRENLDVFLDGVNLVVEATDYTRPEIGVIIAQRARALGIPVIVGAEIGYGASVTSFHPKRRMTYERHFGLPGDLPAAELVRRLIKGDVSPRLSRLIAHIPRYADIRVLAKVQSGKMTAPAIGPAVDTCAGAMASQIVKWLTKQGRPVVAPRVLHSDPHAPVCVVIRWRDAHYYRSLLVCLVRNALHLNPRMEL